MGCTNSKKNTDGTYDPSWFTQKMSVEKKSAYKNPNYADKYKGDKPILVVCTDDGKMTMKNGKVFNTGNHPIELMGPLLYFNDAGFKFEFATTSGSAVVLEMWAFPHGDENIKNLYQQYKAQMDAPKKVSDIPSIEPYAAIFVPGGHGCMINLPQNAALGELLRQAHAKALPTVTLCHGPAALLSTALDGNEFSYKGYQSMCFTDKTDAFTPKIGYIPGEMPWQAQKSLEDLGLTVINKSETGATHVDRELITGDSPQAGVNLGILAAPLVVAHANAQL